MKVLMTGSFNPFTNGHYSIYERACKMFGKDNVFIGIASNSAKDKVNKHFIKWTIAPITNNCVVISDGELVANYCKNNGFDAIIRSMRNAIDLVYEMDMSHWNEELGVSTVFIPCAEGMEKMSSSALRELDSAGINISEYVPNIYTYMRWKQSEVKRVIVTGKMGSGKSSFIEAYDWNSSFIDMDKIAKEIVPEELRLKIKKGIENGRIDYPDLFLVDDIIQKWINEHKEIINYEMSALGTYSRRMFSQTGAKLLYNDSIIVHIEHFDTGKERNIDPDFLKQVRAIQKDAEVIDFWIDDRTMSKEEIDDIVFTLGGQ